MMYQKIVDLGEGIPLEIILIDGWNIEQMNKARMVLATKSHEPYIYFSDDIMENEDMYIIRCHQTLGGNKSFLLIADHNEFDQNKRLQCAINITKMNKDMEWTEDTEDLLKKVMNSINEAQIKVTEILIYKAKK